MKRHMMFLAFTALVACSKAPDAAANNAAENAAIANAVAPVAPAAPANFTCDKIRLDFSGSGLDEASIKSLTDNFFTAYNKACAEHMLDGKKLIDPKSVDKTALFVIDAPEANQEAIYFSPEGTPPRTILEAPFGKPPKIPSADDLHEAIYCNVVGSTEKEQEESGRCLVD